VDRGFSLVEVLVAAAMMTLAIVSVAQIAIVAVRTSHAARLTTIAAALASQKAEQLKALTWALDDAGAPVSDVTTDTAVSPEQPMGGTGLLVSAPETLTRSTAGYVDFLDASGRCLGSGPGPPSGTAFVRRWSIGGFAAGDGRLLQISVRPIAAMDDSSNLRRPEEARVVAVKIRKSP